MHVAPSATASGPLEVYGAPPLRVVPSEQLRLQPTSYAYNPLEQVITEDMDGSTPGPDPSSSPEPEPSSVGSDGGSGGEGEGGGGEGEGGGGEGGGGEGEGGGGIGGSAGGGGGDIRQQASLHFAESDFFVFFLFAEHRMLHFLCLPALDAFLTLFRSSLSHVFLSSSAAQCSGDGAVVRALPLFMPGAGSIFTGVAEGWVSGGVTAPTQFSTHSAASILAGRARLDLERVSFFI